MGEVASARYDRISVSSAYQQVAEAIERQIMTGTLRPGDEVGTEAQLVRQFGLNRSTVREGIRVLEQSGLVRREANRKLFVCSPRHRSLSSRISRAMVLSEVTFRELFETSILLEVAAAEAAAGRATAAQIEQLENNQAQADAAAHDPQRLAEIDRQFHALIASLAGNRVLELAREPAALLFFPTTAVICNSVPEAAPRLLEAHRHIIAAIRSGNVDEARLWMRRHVVDWKRGFERAGHDVDRAVETMMVAMPGEPATERGDRAGQGRR